MAALTAPVRPAARIIPLRALLRRALYAMVQPHKAFAAIRPDERLPYGRCVAFLIAWGAVYALLHFRTVDLRWLWSYDQTGMMARLVNSLLASPGNWLLAVCGVMGLSRVCGHPVSIRWAEIAAFYVWSIWAVMPLVDLAHGLGLPRWSVAVPGLTRSVIAHAGWAVFPILIAQLACLIAHWVGRSPGRWVVSLAVAVACLAFVRLVLEPGPESMLTFLGSNGYSLDFWVMCVWLTALSLIWLVGWRLWFMRLPHWAVIAGTLAAGGGFMLLAVARRFELWWS